MYVNEGVAERSVSRLNCEWRIITSPICRLVLFEPCLTSNLHYIPKIFDFPVYRGYHSLQPYHLHPLNLVWTLLPTPEIPSHIGKILMKNPPPTSFRFLPYSPCFVFHDFESVTCSGYTLHFEFEPSGRKVGVRRIRERVHLALHHHHQSLLNIRGRILQHRYQP